MVRRIFLAKADLADWLNGRCLTFFAQAGIFVVRSERAKAKAEDFILRGRGRRGSRAKPMRPAAKLTMTTPRQGAYTHSFHSF